MGLQLEDLGKIQTANAGLSTHSETYSSGVQELKSALGMNFLFIGVSKVTLSKWARWQSVWAAAAAAEREGERSHAQAASPMNSTVHMLWHHSVDTLM